MEECLFAESLIGFVLHVLANHGSKTVRGAVPLTRWVDAMTKLLARIGTLIVSKPKAAWNRLVNPDLIREELALQNARARALVLREQEAVYAARIRNAKADIDLQVHAAKQALELARITRQLTKADRQPLTRLQRRARLTSRRNSSRGRAA
jgi:hypothetical protein